MQPGPGIGCFSGRQNRLAALTAKMRVRVKVRVRVRVRVRGEGEGVRG